MTTQVLNNEGMIRLKKAAYNLVFIPPALLPLSHWLWLTYGFENIFAWTTLVVMFVLVPLLDYLIGQDPVNPEEKTEVPALSEQRYYRILTLLCVPAQLAALIYGIHIFTTTEFSLMGSLGWLMSVGVIGGVVAINVGHELIHKDGRTEQWAGGILLSSVFYGGFKIEHVRGHHVHVSTPEDASSSRYGQSLYRFLPHAYLHNFLNAWKLESVRLKRKGLPAFSLKNELIWWYGLSFILLAAFSVIWGAEGFLFFSAQSFFAFTLLEIINYVEHYGLHRRKLDNGRYERTTPEHSWNSNYLLTNLFLFQLQRHSDHHAYPKRRYQVLRHHDNSPQLPGGYAAMVVLALVPPLWFMVMNPRVKAYYQGEEHQLS